MAKIRRKIIHIDEERCNGCGLCATACHEGAIDIIAGKARLTREHFCDGLGDCLPACPLGAITFEEREAEAYDEAAVNAYQHEGKGCPGSAMMRVEPASASPSLDLGSQLRQWPVQIKLVAVNAPFFAGARLLVAADCTAYAFGNFHDVFMKGKATIIGCSKLDAIDYSEKLTAIIRGNDIRSLTVVRMEVPCCGGIQRAALQALQASGKRIPGEVITISADGRIVGKAPLGPWAQEEA